MLGDDERQIPMAGAIRVVSVERGHDPRDLVLVPFGGSGVRSATPRWWGKVIYGRSLPKMAKVAPRAASGTESRRKGSSCAAGPVKNAENSSGDSTLSRSQNVEARPADY
jgi:hypothetical protein